jgi:hypothetical protein
VRAAHDATSPNAAFPQLCPDLPGGHQRIVRDAKVPRDYVAGSHAKAREQNLFGRWRCKRESVHDPLHDRAQRAAPTRRDDKRGALLSYERRCGRSSGWMVVDHVRAHVEGTTVTCANCFRQPLGKALRMSGARRLVEE